MTATKDPDKPVSPAAKFFFLRTVFGLLLAVLLFALGFLAVNILVKESLPDLEIPQATITTGWAGADPETIEQEITNNIEKEIKSLPGLKSVASASFDSFSLIAVEFEATEQMDKSMALLRSKVEDAETELPPEADKPRIQQISVNDRPILSFVVLGDVDAGLMGRVVTELENRLERVRGVNEAKIGGQQKEVVRILLIPERMRALGLSPTVIRDKIRSANFDMPWGEIESDEIGATVRLYGKFRSLEELRAMPVARLTNARGRVVRLDEVADVRRGLERETSRASFSWKGEVFRKSMEISLTKRPGADTLEVVEDVRESLKEAYQSRWWPHGLEYRITQDQSERIVESLLGVVGNGLQAMLGVFVVLLVLLTWREGILAGLAIPLTLIGALSIIWLLGYTLNELVVIGMVLALGLLVDVFILMMEGLHHGIFIEEQSFDKAAMSTVRTYALPAAAGQATTILALIPLMAISGMAGKFIRVLPVTASACLVISFVVALLVLVPLSRSLLGRLKGSSAKVTMADRITDSLSAKLRSWSLKATLKSRPRALLWVLGAVGVLVLTTVGFASLPQTMYTARDGRQLGITIELPPGTTLDTSQKAADLVGDVLRNRPYLESVVKLVGKRSPMAQTGLTDALSPSEGAYIVGFSCIFVPREMRDDVAYVYADQLRSEIRELLNRKQAGALLTVVAETGEPSNADPIQIELTGDDMKALRAVSKEVQSELARIPGAVDVRDSLGALKPEVRLIPRREALDFYNISQVDLAAQVRLAMEEDEIARFSLGGNVEDLEIRMGTRWPSRAGGPGGPTSMSELSTIRIFTPEQSSISGLSVLRSRVAVSPISITHSEGKRSVIVMAKTKGRSADQILKEFTPILDRSATAWPAGIAYSYSGEAEESAEAFGSAGLMLIVAVFLVFALLVLMFNSFVQPFIIVTAIPLALIGTFGGFTLLGMPFSFFAMIGVVSLVGIVVNDSIVMVDTMNRHRAGGTDVATAAARGAADRLRPIITTSLTTIIGLTPLALSDPMWQPLCFAIIFGLAVATVSALVITPCLYLLMTRDARGLSSSDRHSS